MSDIPEMSVNDIVINNSLGIPNNFITVNQASDISVFNSDGVPPFFIDSFPLNLDVVQIYKKSKEHTEKLEELEKRIKEHEDEPKHHQPHTSECTDDYDNKDEDGEDCGGECLYYENKHKIDDLDSELKSLKKDFRDLHDVCNIQKDLIRIKLADIDKKDSNTTTTTKVEKLESDINYLRSQVCMLNQQSVFLRSVVRNEMKLGYVIKVDRKTSHYNLFGYFVEFPDRKACLQKYGDNEMIIYDDVFKMTCRFQDDESYYLQMYYF